MKKLKICTFIALLCFCASIKITGQTLCINKLGITTRQSQLDSFPILFPNCNEIDFVHLVGDDINDISPLSQFSKISRLSLLYTNILSLKGIQNVKRFKTWFSLVSNKRLKNLDYLDSLSYARYIVIESCDSLISYVGLSCDTIIRLNLKENKQVADLKGLEFNYCEMLELDRPHLKSLSGHRIKEVFSLFGYYLSHIDSISTLPISELTLFECNNLKHINEIATIKSLKKIELLSNRNLSFCSNTLICQNLDNADFTLILQNNATGCNSKPEIREKCVSELQTFEDHKININYDIQNSLITVKYNDFEKYKFIVFDAFGKQIMIKNLENIPESISLDTHPNGIYLYAVLTDKNYIITSGKLLKLE